MAESLFKSLSLWPSRLYAITSITKGKSEVWSD